jgi:hypothetical protein
MPSTMKRSAWPFLSQCRTCKPNKSELGDCPKPAWNHLLPPFAY